MTVAINDRAQYYCMLFGFAGAAIVFASTTYGLVMFPRVYELPVAMQINTFALPMMVLMLAGNTWTIRRSRILRRDRSSLPAGLLLLAGMACTAAVTVGSGWNWPVFSAWGPALMLAGCLCFGAHVWLHLRPAAKVGAQ